MEYDFDIGGRYGTPGLETENQISHVAFMNISKNARIDSTWAWVPAPPKAVATEIESNDPQDCHHTATIANSSLVTSGLHSILSGT